MGGAGKNKRGDNDWDGPKVEGQNGKRAKMKRMGIDYGATGRACGNGAGVSGSSCC